MGKTRHDMGEVTAEAHASAVAQEEAAPATDIPPPPALSEKEAAEAEEERVREEEKTNFWNEDTPWKNMKGKVMSLACGDMNNLWCLSPPFGAVWVWKWHGLGGSPCINLQSEDSKGRWHFIPGHELQAVDTAADGTVWGLAKDGRTAHFEWTVSGWRGAFEFPKDSREPMLGITCGNKDNVWAFNEQGLPFQFETGAWRIRSPPASGNVVQIKCGADGDAWAIDADGQPFRFDEDFDWLKIGEMKVKKIAVGNKNRVYAIAGVRNYVWRWKKEEERWAHILSPCPFVDIAAGNDGTVWAVDRNKEMWWLHD